MPLRVLAGSSVLGALLAVGWAAPSAAQTALCADPGAVCTAKLPASCLKKLGAGSLAVGAAEADCGAAFAAYQGCLADAAEQCGAAPTQSTGVDADLDARAKAAWEAVKDSGDATELEFVAETYPNTFWAKLAAKRAKELKSAAAAPAAKPQQSATPASSTLAGGMVAEAQQVLKAKCFYYGAVDGVWSSSTKRAWRAYQIRAGIRGSEGLNPRTLAALKSSKATSCVR